jgi:alpha-L-fucosidase
MFIHWGLYSLLGGVWRGKRIEGYNEQIQAHARIPREDYEALAKDFNPVKWDPLAVAGLAKEAGMTFIVLTAKHHDGFSLFHTGQSPFNVVDTTPYGQDIVKGLSEACASVGLGFGVYFSTIDWHYPGATGIDYWPDGRGVRNDNEIPEAHAVFNERQLAELMTGYGPISEVWFDMGRPTPEQSKAFADTVHRYQPETMVSGRVFNYQGDFTVMGDNEIPPYSIEEPWQTPASIFPETWGYRSWQERGDPADKIREHVANLTKVVTHGGNYLLNIGPRGDGSIVEFEAEVLRGIGQWLSQNSIDRAEEPWPAVQAGVDGSYDLSFDLAKTFYRTNGRGYYDPAKLYKLSWLLQTDASGSYRVDWNVPEFACDLALDGEAVSRKFRLSTGTHHLELRLRVPEVVRPSLRLLPASGS